MNNNINDGGPAFPEQPSYNTPHGTITVNTNPGMSLLDWFAGQALSGMHARDTYDDGQATPQQRAKLAYIDAAAMIAEREGGTP